MAGAPTAADGQEEPAGLHDPCRGRGAGGCGGRGEMRDRPSASVTVIASYLSQLREAVIH